MIIKNNLIPAKGFSAMSIFPFIFVRKDWLNKVKDNHRFTWKLIWKDYLNHEHIHAAQQLEVSLFGLALAIVLSILLCFSWWMLLIPIFLYYVLYVLDWLIGTIAGERDAYRTMIFEREAYANENNLDYLSKRKPFAFLKYF